MQPRRRRRAAALAIAVLAGGLGTLGPVPVAAAEPSPGTAPAATPASPVRPGAGSPVWPRPQSLRENGDPVPVTEEVALAVGASADPYAVEALRALLRQAGARRITEPAAGPRPPAGALVVRVATQAPGGGSREGLPSGGYRLTVGRGTVTLSGAGGDGLFHAVQTLRQLLRPDGTIRAVVVRDWPGTAVRGVAEGFYGTPWTHRERLAQLDFLGRTKQNRYLYAPGDDLYRQARWREPYPAAERAQFRELAERARRNHVTPAWAVSPGQSMCFSSDADVRALTRKLDGMRALGFRAFQLQFQDVSYSEWHCDADAKTFGSGPGAAARAQARVANAVARHLAARQPGTAPLTVMPTEYYQDGPTAYRRALAGALDGSVRVAWTGVGVVPRTITGRELAEAKEVFGHPLVTLDNYPVNDYAPGRLFLGPYQGREPAVATGSAELLANAMEQPEASRIPLFTAADYAWNPRAYRPQESWRAAIDDLAGGDERREEALTALAGNAASSVLDPAESAYLRPLIEAFWRERATGGDRAADRLREEFALLREVPGRLARGGPAAEVAPWSERLAGYGEAGTRALDMLGAQSAGDPAAAWAAYRDLGRLRGRTAPSRVTVGEGVLDPFLRRAQKAYEAWAGLDRAPALGPGDAADGRTVTFPGVRSLDTVTVLADPGTRGQVEVRVPGGGWRRVGALAKSGATELAVRRDAGAVRVTGPDSARVRHLVPWFAGPAEASLELTRTRTDAETGGTERLTARLASLRPGDVRGTLTARAPEGVEVRLPKGPLTVPRGQEVDVALEVTVAPGTPSRSYDIKLAFGGTDRTLTVRAFPRTAGPDLARTGRASSSADETPDFPAPAANDGDPGTRWSSPADDGAWWQGELERPVRLGRVSLHWQDAYASAYRVQVSADGRHWRTAAAVRDGRGGRETVRMDERDVRYVRVQGDERATRFGYSLWSVEAYAVAE
ncbi:beta-N-acetylglucosaminidase domain-containing protein [Streptomyces sp. NPDC052309]|uniref:beta-N-acetylglucosaminidase domain-containing protein n=1 Tax=Streptomyces sp. NPDC052309 TaxID=3155421 RepID=UPI00343A5A99